MLKKTFRNIINYFLFLSCPRIFTLLKRIITETIQIYHRMGSKFKPIAVQKEALRELKDNNIDF